MAFAHTYRCFQAARSPVIFPLLAGLSLPFIDPSILQSCSHFQQPHNGFGCLPPSPCQQKYPGQNRMSIKGESLFRNAKQRQFLSVSMSTKLCRGCCLVHLGCLESYVQWMLARGSSHGSPTHTGLCARTCGSQWHGSAAFGGAHWPPSCIRVFHRIEKSLLNCVHLFETSKIHYCDLTSSYCPNS